LPLRDDVEGFSSFSQRRRASIISRRACVADDIFRCPEFAEAGAFSRRQSGGRNRGGESGMMPCRQPAARIRVIAERHERVVAREVLKPS